MPISPSSLPEDDMCDPAHCLFWLARLPQKTVLIFYLSNNDNDDYDNNGMLVAEAMLARVV